MSKTTDAELSRWIAEKLEPTPKPSAYNDSHNFPRMNSASGLWTFPTQLEHYESCYSRRGGRCDCDASHGLREAKPRDTVNDPDMTMMLLKRLMQMERVYVALQPDQIVINDYRDGYSRMSYIFKPLDNLGRSIAEAFALANGWK